MNTLNRFIVTFIFLIIAAGLFALHAMVPESLINRVLLSCTLIIGSSASFIGLLAVCQWLSPGGAEDSPSFHAGRPVPGPAPVAAGRPRVLNLLARPNPVQGWEHDRVVAADRDTMRTVRKPRRAVGRGTGP
jgi:hypothetical protein